MEINVNANFRKRGKVRIPAKVLARLEVMGEVAGSDEYGMYLSAEVDPIRWEATIDPDIFEIPEQRISTASIRMLDVPDDMYANKWGERCFNAVVHRHPSGCNSFSGTDEEYINRFFEISFIYQRGFIVPKCIMNRMEAVGEYTQLECDVEIIDGSVHTEVVKEEVTYPTSFHVHDDIHNNEVRHHSRFGFKQYRRVYSHPKLVLDGYEDIKREILATEEDMSPEELKKKFIKYGYSREELVELQDIESIQEDIKLLGYSGGLEDVLGS